MWFYVPYIKNNAPNFMMYKMKNNRLGSDTRTGTTGVMRSAPAGSTADDEAPPMKTATMMSSIHASVQTALHPWCDSIDSMLLKLQERVHTLEMQNAALELKLNKLQPEDMLAEKIKIAVITAIDNALRKTQYATTTMEPVNPTASLPHTTSLAPPAPPSPKMHPAQKPSFSKRTRHERVYKPYEIRVHRVPLTVNEDKLKKALGSLGSELQDVKLIPYKQLLDTQLAILLLTEAGFQMMKSWKRIKIEWAICPIDAKPLLLRCKSCALLGHTAKICNGLPEGIAKENRGSKCIDCLSSNITLGCNRKTDHPTNDPSCPTRKVHLRRYIRSRKKPHCPVEANAHAQAPVSTEETPDAPSTVTSYKDVNYVNSEVSVSNQRSPHNLPDVPSNITTCEDAINTNSVNSGSNPSISPDLLNSPSNITPCEDAINTDSMISGSNPSLSPDLLNSPPDVTSCKDATNINSKVSGSEPNLPTNTRDAPCSDIATPNVIPCEEENNTNSEVNGSNKSLPLDPPYTPSNTILCKEATNTNSDEISGSNPSLPSNLLNSPSDAISGKDAIATSNEDENNTNSEVRGSNSSLPLNPPYTPSNTTLCKDAINANSEVSGSNPSLPSDLPNATSNGNSCKDKIDTNGKASKNKPSLSPNPPKAACCTNDKNAPRTVKSRQAKPTTSTQPQKVMLPFFNGRAHLPLPRWVPRIKDAEPVCLNDILDDEPLECSNLHTTDMVFTMAGDVNDFLAIQKTYCHECVARKCLPRNAVLSSIDYVILPGFPHGGVSQAITEYIREMRVANRSHIN